MSVEIETKIKAKLAKKKIRVVGSIYRGGNIDHLLVVFREKGKIKVGSLNTHFRQASGVKTFLTFNESTKRFWIDSDSNWCHIDNTLESAISNDTFEETYRLLDIDKDIASVIE